MMKGYRVFVRTKRVGFDVVENHWGRKERG